MNESFEYWLESYDAQIQAAVADETLGEHPQWPLLLTGTATKGVYETAVGPLINAKWGQSPYYNDLCPEDASDEKAVAIR